MNSFISGIIVYFFLSYFIISCIEYLSRLIFPRLIGCPVGFSLGVISHILSFNDFTWLLIGFYLMSLAPFLHLVCDNFARVNYSVLYFPVLSHRGPFALWRY